MTMMMMIAFQYGFNGFRVLRSQIGGAASTSVLVFSPRLNITVRFRYEIIINEKFIMPKARVLIWIRHSASAFNNIIRGKNPRYWVKNC